MVPLQEEYQAGKTQHGAGALAEAALVLRRPAAYALPLSCCVMVLYQLRQLLQVWPPWLPRSGRQAGLGNLQLCSLAAAWRQLHRNGVRLLRRPGAALPAAKLRPPRCLQAVQVHNSAHAFTEPWAAALVQHSARLVPMLDLLTLDVTEVALIVFG